MFLSITSEALDSFTTSHASMKRFVDRYSLLPSVFLVALVAILPTFFIALAYVVVTGDTNEYMDFGHVSDLEMFSSVVFIAPVAETLIFVAVFDVARLFVKSDDLASLVSVVLLAGLHSLAEPAWGFIILWPTYLFSLLFLTRKHEGVRYALFAMGLCHAIYNTPSAVVLIFAE